MKWFLVFTATVTADFFWARWAVHATNKQAFRASFYGGAIIACSGFTIFEYTQDPWLLIPAALGAGLGTFIAVQMS